MKSLTLVLSSVVFGWFLTAVVNICAERAGADELAMFLVHTDLGWPANVAIAAKFFIYYLTYPDYQRAFRRQLGLKPLAHRRTVAQLPHSAVGGDQFGPRTLVLTHSSSRER